MKRQTDRVSVERLAASGVSVYGIARRLGISRSCVESALNKSSLPPPPPHRDDVLARASDKLVLAIAREAQEIGRRRALARVTGGGTGGQRASGQLRLPPEEPRQAIGRDACPRCGTRGDLGCRHQRPDPFLQSQPSHHTGDPA